MLMLEAPDSYATSPNKEGTKITSVVSRPTVCRPSTRRSTLSRPTQTR